jgi:glycosyltransferase involved in cell wall biosynthesis
MGVVKNPAALGAMEVLERLAYRSMSAGVALSPGIREGMRAKSASSKPVAMIPNGCDLDLFRPPVRGEKESPPFSIPEDGLRCIFMGAHGIANGLDAVLDAASVLKARGSDHIHFLFVGDGMLKPRLQARTAREGLTNCRFYDPLPKTRLAGLLRHMDVGLMILDNVPAFYYGTSPNKFFDYIASGLPVLNNYPGWLADMIAENRCGKAVPPASPAAFADALEELAADPAGRREMGRNSRSLAERRFDRRVLADELTRFLEGLVWQECSVPE